ncbi:MAG: phage major capsid protein [Alphaproteobacteria bacterium]|nr:MAG: phage major capsid protein [Alphaproteobacteria bacterium]
MTELMEIRVASEALAGAFEQFKQANDTRLAALERRGGGDVLTDEKVARLDHEIERLQSLITHMGVAARRPGGATKARLTSAQEDAHKQAFLSYLTKGNEADLAQWQSKAMSVNSDADGGYLAPPELAERVVSRQFDTTPMRQLATVMTVNAEAVEMLRDTDEAEALWVSELATRADTNQPSLARIRIPAYELHAQPKATQKLLDDAAIQVEDWLVAKIADRFARRENAAFIGGDGVTQPRGITNYATAATGDSTRAWGTLEHVTTGVNGDFAASAPADKLIELMHKLKAGYLPKAAWLAPRSVAEKIRKMKDQQNSYLWQPALQAGVPPTLLGYPFHLAEDMPTLATNSLSLAFGNFAQGYTIVDRSGISVLRDPFTAAPFVKFRCRKRVGGDVVNFEAIKLMKFST